MPKKFKVTTHLSVLKNTRETSSLAIKYQLQLKLYNELYH